MLCVCVCMSVCECVCVCVSLSVTKCNSNLLLSKLYLLTTGNAVSSRSANNEVHVLLGSHAKQHDPLTPDGEGRTFLRNVGRK